MRATRLPKLLLKALRTDSNSIATVPLNLTKITGQTANFMEVRDTDDTTVLAKIDATGKLTSVAGTGAGNVVTTDGVQTLTNKTLTSPKVGTAILDTAGNELVKVTATASAVNEITVSNAATSGVPTIDATGDDASIPIQVRGKGTGAVYLGQVTCQGVALNGDQPILDSVNNELIKFTKAATAVNEITVANAATGNAPAISATGEDTNIDLSLAGKGTGGVSAPGLKFGTNILPLKVAHAVYNFAVDGGVMGAITPAITSLIPDNAIIIGGIVNSTTAVTATGAATLSIGTTAGSSATSILGVTGKASLGTDALVAATPTFAAATYFKMSAAGSINVTVGTDNLLTGVVEIWVFYMTASA